MLYLVAHPATDLPTKLHHGDLDSELSPKGIKDIGAISEAFRNQKLDLIVTPSVARNSETATLLASITGAHIFVDEGLRTWRQPAFSGMLQSKVRPMLKTYLHHPDVRVPQGESANQFLKRLEKAVLKYQGMAHMGKLDIALSLNSLSIDAVAAKFKTVDLGFSEEGAVYEVTGPSLTLAEVR